TVDPYEIYDLSGHYTHATGQQGEVLARRRLEAIEVQGKTFKGTSNCRAMGCGYTFELTQHFDHDRDVREDRQFLLLSVEHRGSNNYLSDQPASYDNSFECIRHKIPFRPLVQVPRPIISGPL
ncbi:contractile injection system protein, VgrG/Pvc8 family, partial [Pseudomonas sp. EA_15y_Pfl1_P102]|uniref:contractile injection system protein, VgrG/Pvc8 family n=1 Tax=Pseudomonas sp. EA_15y_Pfl1_P102 TaxID=3088685 RepID=UPI0030DBEE3E